MPLMSDTRIAMLTNAVQQRAQKFMALDPITLEPDEFVNLFIQPDHIDPLRQTQELVGSVGSNYMIQDQYVTDGGNMQPLRFYVSFEGSPPIIIPQYAWKGTREGAKPENLEKLNKQIVERYRLGCIFGDAIDAILHLNKVCSDMRAVRALFPAITILLNDIAVDSSSGAAKLANKLDNNKTVTSLPSIPREVMRRLQEVTDVITATTLIPNDVRTHKLTPQTATFAFQQHHPIRRMPLIGDRSVGTFL